MNRYASLRQGLVGAWCPSLGASGFRLIDRSENNNHGTLVNMDPGTDWVPSGGKLALDFDVSRVDISSNCLNGLTSASITMWVKSRGASQADGGGLAEFNQGGSNSHYPWVDGIGYINWLRQNRVTVTLSSSVDRTTWHLVSCTTQSNGRWRFYQNTIMVSDVAAESTIDYDTRGIWIGASGNGTTPAYWYDGQIDDIRLYNRALTATEINQLYQGGRGVGLAPERIKHRRKTSASATNRRRRIIIGASS